MVLSWLQVQKPIAVQSQLKLKTRAGLKLNCMCPFYSHWAILTILLSFKLRLRPRTMQLNMNGMRLSPLPRRKTPVHVFGDFLAYLYSCTRSFITDTHANGASLWSSVESDIQLVLSHPNGWEGPQQTRMRNAAVYGKLVPDTDAGRARIRFVTEGEASLHACVLSGLAADVLSVRAISSNSSLCSFLFVLQNPSKHGFLIVDAGGGTLDISAYAIKGTSPLAMEEIAPPDCWSTILVVFN